MKRTLQLFYFMLLTFFIIGNASAATDSIEWDAYAGTGLYVLDLDPQSTYPRVESYRRTIYDINGGKKVFTYNFNGIQSSWSFKVDGIKYKGANPGWNPSSQKITQAMRIAAGKRSVFLSNSKVPVPTAVPIPSAIWLLGSAFIGLVGFRRKFRKA
jgi:hypothetical protein